VRTFAFLAKLSSATGNTFSQAPKRAFPRAKTQVISMNV